MRIKRMFTIVKSLSKRDFSLEENEKFKWLFKRDINILTMICQTLLIVFLLNIIIIFQSDKIVSLIKNINNKNITCIKNNV